MNKELFIKYIQNRCSDSELNEVARWFNNDAGTIEGRRFLYHFWKEMKDDEQELDENAVHLLNRIHHDLNKEQSSKLLRRSNNNLKRYRKRQIFLQTISKVAAILFIPLIIFTFYLVTNIDKSEQIAQKTSAKSFIKVHSPVGSVSQVDLPDGSRVWLNQNTTLIYQGTSFKESRNVCLEGEAYFEVKHDPDLPFVVSVDDLNIVARGTEFNVLAFPDMQRVETTLKEGKVLLYKKDNTGTYKEILEMFPNELAVYHKDKNKLEYDLVNTDKYTLWKDGLLIFENDPLHKVAERLGRFYNVDIIINDSILSEYTYTATFEDETLYQVMELLKLATPVEYKVTSRKKLKDGTYSKRKVYMNYSGN